MGGVSASHMRHDPAGHGVFAGEVSLENNGGFASVRALAEVPETAVGALACLLEVRGDGRRYKFNLRTDGGFDGITHQASFQPPAGEWAVVRLPLEGFVATWRGRPASAEPPTAADQADRPPHRRPPGGPLPARRARDRAGRLSPNPAPSMPGNPTMPRLKPST
jgi:hypothetical protein